MTQPSTGMTSPLFVIEGLGARVSSAGAAAPPAGAPIAPLTLVGLPPTARALALLQIATLHERPLVVIASGDSEATRLASDLRALARLTGTLDPDAVVTFPALDAD